MAKAIEQLKSGLITGKFSLGLWGEATGSVRQQVHDGDTINVRALGNFGVRFLGIDAPEMSFTLPESDRFISISNPEWEAFLTDPFATQYPAISLDPGLQAYLTGKVGAGTATNHHVHAQAAERFLETQIQQDLTELGQSPEEFQFFLAFAGEVMDRYGRLLAYINRYQSSGQRPLDYNNRLLQAGHVNPYLIFPNINPFRKQTSVLASIPRPGTANQLATQESALRQARQWIQNARTQNLGVFNAQNPLRLQAFELRFLAQRRAPNRWVIDLSQADNRLISPQNYYTIPNVEDRLFIPEEYVPAFVEAGWQRMG
jgi:endonuclease YncB( thermonuclease family)